MQGWEEIGNVQIFPQAFDTSASKTILFLLQSFHVNPNEELFILIPQISYWQWYAPQ